jgi:hypothetical protein
MTKAGGRCQAKPLRGGDYCFIHEPRTARKRAQARKRGGAATRTQHGAASLPAQVRTLDQAREILHYCLAEIEPMPNSLPRARVLIALFDSFVKALEIGELETRIAALEANQK